MKIFRRIFNRITKKVIRIADYITGNIHYYLECHDGDESWNLYYDDMSIIQKAIPELLEIRPNIKIAIKTYNPKASI